MAKLKNFPSMTQLHILTEFQVVRISFFMSIYTGKDQNQCRYILQNLLRTFTYAQSYRNNNQNASKIGTPPTLSSLRQEYYSHTSQFTSQRASFIHSMEFLFGGSPRGRNPSSRLCQLHRSPRLQRPYFQRKSRSQYSQSPSCQRTIKRKHPI